VAALVMGMRGSLGLRVSPFGRRLLRSDIRYLPLLDFENAQRGTVGSQPSWLFVGKDNLFQAIVFRMSGV